MAPTLPSWKKEVAVWRHGEARHNEMLCQMSEKAPKWSFCGGTGHQIHEGLVKNTDFNVVPPKKFVEDSKFNLGNSRSASTPSLRSTSSSTRSETGADYAPRDSPTTPLYSFGTTKRPSPFPGQMGPGPEVQRSLLKGPKYSMGGGPTKGLHLKRGGPGPADYVPRDLSHSPRPTMGRGDTTKAKISRSASVGGGLHYYKDSMIQDGPKYSMGNDGRKAKRDIDNRQIGHNWTYFGYDDFGHTEHADFRPLDKLPVIKCR